MTSTAGSGPRKGPDRGNRNDDADVFRSKRAVNAARVLGMASPVVAVAPLGWIGRAGQSRLCRGSQYAGAKDGAVVMSFLMTVPRRVRTWWRG